MMPSRKSHAQLLRKTGGVGLSFLGVFSLADGEKFSLRATLHRFFHYFPPTFSLYSWQQPQHQMIPTEARTFFTFLLLSFFFFTPLTPHCGWEFGKSEATTTLRGDTFSREFRSITGRRITASSGAWKCYMFTYPAFSVSVCV